MRRYIILGIAVIIIAALSVTLFILNQKGGRELLVNIFTSGQIASAPMSEGGTIVSFKVNKSANGTVLIVEWKRLPNGTNTLIIWKAPSGTSVWTVWKRINITPGSENSGIATIDIGDLNLENYAFSIQAVNVTGGPGNPTKEQVLWTSPVIEEQISPSGTIKFIEISTSTPSLPPLTSLPSSPPAPSSTPPSSNPPPPSTPPQTTTPQANNLTPTSTASSFLSSSSSATSSSSSSNGNNSSNGTTVYYTYTPQQTPSAQNVPGKGSFWVQYVNQSIEIGWQNLPAATDKLIVSRSKDQNGSWTAVLTQSNPNPAGPYSIKLVDDTFNNPYYYKLDAYANGSLIQTFGPEYLAPQ